MRVPQDFEQWMRQVERRLNSLSARSAPDRSGARGFDSLGASALTVGTSATFGSIDMMADAQPYDVDLTGNTTNPSLGAGGALVGYYTAAGRIVYSWGQYTLSGSGWSAGAGLLTLSLPFPATDVNTGSNHATIIGRASSSAPWFQGFASVVGSRLSGLYLPSGTNGALTPQNGADPIGGTTPGDGYSIQWRVTYVADL